MPSCWSYFSPKHSNGRGTAPHYPPLSRESQVLWVFLFVSSVICLFVFVFWAPMMAKAPRHPPYDNSSGDGSYYWTQSRNRRLLMTLQASKNTLLASHPTPAHAPVMVSKWRDGWDLQPHFYTLCLALELCRDKEKTAAVFARPAAGAQLAHYSHCVPQPKPKSIWDDTPGSLNITSRKAGVFWGQLNITREGFFVCLFYLLLLFWFVSFVC